MTDVVLPCLDEAAALPWVLSRIPAGYRAIVADNGSTDGSPEVAAAHGAVVVRAHRRGFGAAVHAGVLAAELLATARRLPAGGELTTVDGLAAGRVEHGLAVVDPVTGDTVTLDAPTVPGNLFGTESRRPSTRLGSMVLGAISGTGPVGDDPLRTLDTDGYPNGPGPERDDDLLCVLDADGSLDPAQLPLVAGPVLAGTADLVLGRRRPTRRGAWPVHARLGNRVVAGRLHRAAGVPVRDLGPMRAVRRSALLTLGLRDRRFGYPLEMVLRAGRAGWRIAEVDVDYAPRSAGTRSKVTGTLLGTARTVRDMTKVLSSS